MPLAVSAPVRKTIISYCLSMAPFFSVHGYATTCAKDLVRPLTIAQRLKAFVFRPRASSTFAILNGEIGARERAYLERRLNRVVKVSVIRSTSPIMGLAGPMGKRQRTLEATLKGYIVGVEERKSAAGKVRIGLRIRVTSFVYADLASLKSSFEVARTVDGTDVVIFPWGMVGMGGGLGLQIHLKFLNGPVLARPSA